MPSHTGLDLPESALRPSARIRRPFGPRTVPELTSRVWERRSCCWLLNRGVALPQAPVIDLGQRPFNPVGCSSLLPLPCVRTEQFPRRICGREVALPRPKIGRVAAFGHRLRRRLNADPDAGGRRSGGTRPRRKRTGSCLTSGIVFPGEDARVGIHFLPSTSLNSFSLARRVRSSHLGAGLFCPGRLARVRPKPGWSGTRPSPPLAATNRLGSIAGLDPTMCVAQASARRRGPQDFGRRPRSARLVSASMEPDSSGFPAASAAWAASVAARQGCAHPSAPLGCVSVITWRGHP